MEKIYELAGVTIYISLYVIVSVCLSISAHADDKKEKYLFFSLATALIVVFAAMREGVGTDYYSYVGIYQIESKRSLSVYLKDFGLSSTPPLMYLIAKIAAIFHSEKIFFLLCAAAVFIPGAAALQMNKNRVSVFLSSFAFLITIFTFGLNGMKQAAAVAFSFLAFQYLLKKKPMQFLVFMAFSVAFHPTAVIILPFYMMNLPCFRKKDGQWEFLLFLLVPLCAVAALIFYPQLLKLLGGRFSGYITPGVDDAGKNYSFYLSSFVLLGILAFSRKLIKKNQNNGVYLLMMLIGVIFESLGFASGAVKRISLYFSVYGALLLPQMTVVCESQKRSLLPDAVREKSAEQWNDFFESGIFVYYFLLFFLDYYVFKHSAIIPFRI